MRKLTFTVIGWIISAIAIAGLVAKLDWPKVSHSLLQAKPHWLLLAALMNIPVNILKTWRWQLLMHNKKQSHFSTIFKATMIGLAGNQVLPARGGDWYRIYLLGKWENVSRAALASMTGLDKLFDGIAILSIFAIASHFATFPNWVRQGTFVTLGIIIGSLIICIILRIHHRRNADIADGKMGKIRSLVYNLGAGMSILEEKGRFGATLFLSLMVALTYTAMLYVVQLSFGLDLPLWVPILVYTAINLSVWIPTAPSGIGPFEVAAVLAYTWQGLSKEISFNVALMYHVVLVVPVVLIGGYYYVTAYKQRTTDTKTAPSE